MNRLLTIAQMTLHEAARRRILAAALTGALAFLLLYTIGFHFVGQKVSRLERTLILNFFTLAGLYAAHFLTVMTAVLLPLDTLSGEIASGVLQTVASKPVRRSEILLGKWLAFVMVTLAYQAIVVGGVLLIARLVGHFTPPDVAVGVPLLMLEAACLVTLSIAGGTRFTTVTNGVLAFGLYGLAFLGGWIEQVGTLVDNVAARNIGTIASLLMPTESLWQLAAYHMQPRLMTELHLTPFSYSSVPSAFMVGWAIAWAVVVLALGLRGISKRPL